MMKLLKTYIRHGHHEGIVVTLSEDGSPNTAPMGVDLMETSLLLKPYLTTKTYSNLRRVPELTINFTWDSLLFYRSLYSVNDLFFTGSRRVKPPIINGCIDLYVEGEVSGLREHPDKGFSEVLVRPLEIYLGSGSRLAYSRADALLIEVMIYLTKAEAFFKRRPEVSKALVKRVLPYLAVAEKVGSDEIREVALQLRHRLESFMRDAY